MSQFQLLSPHPSTPFNSVSSMDYSYFNSAPQPYQYYVMSQTPTQPMDMDSFGSTPQQQQQQPQRPPAPAPQQQQQQPQSSQQQQATQFNSPFAAFQDSFQYDHSNYIHSTAAQSQLPSRAPSRLMTNAPSISPGLHPFESIPMSTTESIPPDEMMQQRSSSEGRDDMTPQQSKRKAQNRAAQRAFRERKEKHLKDLETQVNTLQKQSMLLDSQNEQLRKELARVATENEILRATSTGQPSLGEEDNDFGPLGYQSTDFATKKETAARRAQMLGSFHTIVIDENSGEPLLNSGQTWDYIQDHQSFHEGIIDIGDVIDRLKKVARCDGQGPVFRESDIRKAISESAAAGGRDELL